MSAKRASGSIELCAVSWANQLKFRLAVSVAIKKE